jgi:hypothetical protein
LRQTRKNKKISKTILKTKLGVKKRNGTERNGINGIFSETERNETENFWENEKRKET